MRSTPALRDCILMVGLLMFITLRCAAQPPADGLTDEQRQKMAYHLQRIDPTARNAFLEARVIDLMPPGFKLDPKKNYIYNSDYAAQHFRKGAAHYRVELRREKADSDRAQAADRYARWFAPQTNNVARFYEKNMGLGGHSVCVAIQFPGNTRLVEANFGRWIFIVRQVGMIGSPEARKMLMGGDIAYASEEQAVDELKNLARRIWSRLTIVEHKPPAPPQVTRAPAKKQPTVVKPPVKVQPAPQTAQPVNLSEQDQQYLDLIQKMDAILRSVEQPLQESLTKIRLLAQSQNKMRHQMRELSRLRASVDDKTLKKKIQDRINNTVKLLRDTAAQVREEIAAAKSTALKAKQGVYAIFNEQGFGDLYLAALTRRELIDARVQLLDTQIAFNAGDLAAAQRAVDAMRSNYRLRGHAMYLDGMILLQQGQSLDALASFRNAHKYGNQSPGEHFQALERRTEIHVLQTLKRLSAETSQSFDEDFSNWIKAKGELNQPKDQTQFEWMVARFLKRPWYDTISGVTGTGIAEADQRGREAGIVADDMAVNQVGLNFIIALRENLSLREIQKLSTRELREAASKRWGHDLPEDQIKRMRHAIHHAMQMPQLKALANENAHLEQSAFSGKLAKQIQLQDRWAMAADVAAMGASMVDSWTVVTTLAPTARLSFAGTGQLVRATDAAQRFKNTVTLGEWFAASRPVEGALRQLNETAAGRAAIRAAANVQEFADQGVLETVAVTGANMVLDTGAAYAAREYLGQPGEMLVDAITTLGVTNPQLYQNALEKMTRQRVIDFAESMGKNALKQHAQIAKLDSLVDDLPRVGANASQFKAFRSKLDNAGFDLDFSDRVEGLVAAVESGNEAMVMQARRDLERLRSRQSHLALQAQKAAAQFRQAAPTLSQPPSILDAQPQQGIVEAPRTQQAQPIGDPLADPLDTRPAQTIRNTDTPGNTTLPQDIGDPLATNNIGTIRNPSTHVNPTPEPVGDPLSTFSNPSTHRNTAHADEPFSTLNRSHQPPAALSNLTTHADQLLSQRRFTEAIESYQRQLSELPVDHPHRARLESRVDVARQAMQDQKRISEAMSQTTELTQSPNLFDQPNNQSVVQRIVNGSDQQGQWVAVGTEIPTAMGTASKPRFVKDATGRKLAVTKTAIGMAGHPEGRAEVLASLVAQQLGRNTPRSRLSSFTVDIDGKAQRLVISELMPNGIELKELNPTTAQLLARKDAITEDFVFAMFLGDGDRHFGNLRITPNEQMIGFDYGLADILPTHPYRQTEILQTIEPMYQQAKSKLETLLNTPGSPQSQIDQIRRELSTLQMRALYFNLENPMKIPTPSAPGFTAFVEQTMNMHMTWGSRQWTDHELFMRTMTYEDFLPHIQKLEQAMQKPGVLDHIVDQAMQGHPQIQYTRKLLQKRLEVMRKVFKSRYPARLSMHHPSSLQLDPQPCNPMPRRMAA